MRREECASLISLRRREVCTPTELPFSRGVPTRFAVGFATIITECCDGFPGRALPADEVTLAQHIAQATRLLPRADSAMGHLGGGATIPRIIRVQTLFVSPSAAALANDMILTRSLRQVAPARLDQILSSGGDAPLKSAEQNTKNEELANAPKSIQMLTLFYNNTTVGSREIHPRTQVRPVFSISRNVPHVPLFLRRRIFVQEPCAALTRTATWVEERDGSFGHCSTNPAAAKDSQKHARLFHTSECPCLLWPRGWKRGNCCARAKAHVGRLELARARHCLVAWGVVPQRSVGPARCLPRLISSPLLANSLAPRFHF